MNTMMKIVFIQKMNWLFFENRRKAFFENGKQGNTVEEAHEKIRRNYKNGL